MSVKTRLDKLEEQALTTDKIEVWIAIQLEGDIDRYNVSKSGADGSQVLSRAEVQVLPGHVLAIHRAEQVTSLGNEEINNS